MKNQIINLRTGMSITELLIAMTLVGALMSATFYVFSTFFASSMTNQRQSSEQADVQTGSQYLKWDIFMSGFGMSAEVLPMANTDNTGADTSDVLSLQSTAFNVGGGTGRWSYILSPVTSSNQILIRRWNEPANEITKGDKIVILSATKGLVGLPVYTVNDTATAVGPAGQTAWRLTLNNTISTSSNFVFAVPTAGVPQTTTYSVVNRNLMRDATLFMPDVINMQVSFWVDVNGNKSEDGGETVNDLSIVELNPRLADNIMLMRISLVSATRGEKTYIFPFQTLNVGNATIRTSKYGRNFKYNVWQSDTRPRNL